MASVKPKSKLGPGASANTEDGAFTQKALQQDGADEFGKRKVTPSGPRKMVQKAGAMGAKDNAEGMPGASSNVQDGAFKKAYAAIERLRTSKDPESGNL